MKSLSGRMNSKQVAEYLIAQAEVLQKYIDAKLNPATLQNRPTERRKRILEKMRSDADRMKLIQSTLLALALLHETNQILRFPHLEDIRNKKQIQLLFELEEIHKSGKDIGKFIRSHSDELEAMAIYSNEDWQGAYKQLIGVLENYYATKFPISEKEYKMRNMEQPTKEIESELEFKAMEELERMRKEQQKKKTGLEGNVPKPYPIQEEKLLGNVEERTKTVPELKLTFKKNKSISGQKIITSNHAEKFIRSLFEPDTIQVQEQFIVLHLNRSNEIIGYHMLSKGGLSGTVADTRLIFSSAMLSLSTSIVLAHNHPSGNLKPSEADIQLTRRMVETGKILDVPVLDHIIITEESFFSFADNGLIY